MSEGDVALASLPQADGRSKPGPVLLLRRVPPYGDWLVCGVSTQLHQKAAGFDETIVREGPDFRRSGLKAPSLIRLGFLVAILANHLHGVLGSVAPERHRRLLGRLSSFLQPNI